MEYLVVSLFAKLEDINSDNVRLKKLHEALSLFKCEKNRDEQNFIRNKAIDFELHNKARTYLIISNECIVAYFTIAFKSIDLVEMSQTEKKKITGGNKLVSHYSAFLLDT